MFPLSTYAGQAYRRQMAIIANTDHPDSQTNGRRRHYRRVKKEPQHPHFVIWSWHCETNHYFSPLTYPASNMITCFSWGFSGLLSRAFPIVNYAVSVLRLQQLRADVLRSVENRTLILAANLPFLFM